MDTFAAVADPTRRRIIELIGDGELDAGTISTQFSLSQPAISRHLRVLREAGILEAAKDGQRRVYRLRPGALSEVESWVDRYRKFWAGRLDDLARLAEEEE